MRCQDANDRIGRDEQMELREDRHGLSLGVAEREGANGEKLGACGGIAQKGI